MRLKKVGSRKRESLQGHGVIQGASTNPPSTQGHALPCRVVPLPASCQNSLLCNDWGLCLESQARNTHFLRTCAPIYKTQENPRGSLCLCAFTGTLVIGSGMNRWGTSLLRCKLWPAVHMAPQGAASPRWNQPLLCSASPLGPCLTPTLLHTLRWLEGAVVTGRGKEEVGQGQGTRTLGNGMSQAASSQHILHGPIGLN